MGFSLASAFIEIRGDTKHSDAAIDGTKRKLITLPGVKEIKIRVDDSALNAGIASAKGKLAGLNVGSIGAGAVGGLAAGAAMSVIPAALGAMQGAVLGAANLGESQSKMGVVFGESAGLVDKFANSMHAAFGSSKQEMIDAASDFGILAKGVGQTQAEAANFSISLAKMADDASSFHNTSLGVALEKIRAGLKGESEPLRAFGVMLDEDAVKAEAFRLGLWKMGKELTQSSKITARYSLIRKGLSDTEGDHARTQGEFMGQLRELAGRLAGLAVEIGGTVLPVLTLFLRKLNPVLEIFEAIAAQVSNVTRGIGQFASAVSGATFGDASSAATPSAKKTPQAAAAGGASGLGVKFGIEAARTHIAEEKAKADQDRVLQRVRDEIAASDKIKTHERINTALIREAWIQAEEAKLRSQVKWSDKTEAETKALRIALRKDAEESLKSEERRGLKPLAGQKSGVDTTAALNFMDKVKSVLGDKLPQAIGMAADVKQRGLGVVGKGMEAIVDMGAPEHAKRERMANYHTEFLGGREYSQRIQSAALGADNRKEEKEMVKLQAQTVLELKTGIAGLISAIKSTRSIPGYQ